MDSRQHWIDYCLTFPGAYEDYPFHDGNWTVMRRRDNKRCFAYLFSHEGGLWLNLKCAPDEGDFLRQVYPSVRPAYHMNKAHWISVILDGAVPKEEIQGMIARSFSLAGNGKRTERPRNAELSDS